ncbi:MAG: alpha-amylase family glycosyl hydrolase [Prevotella sp.]|nr:alpha-amylase family glycosyl hydrolase [Prevotella sp.]MCM1075251.1 alpha-amylase family glycosyl hydrolase [Ruminococcus sp.]
MKALTLTALAVLMAIPTLSAKDRLTRNPNATNEDVILHTWSWNFPTIAENMKTIADAGYTIIQTSPAQACLTPEGGNKHLFSETPDGKGGNWYHYYQPTDWKIGNDIVGTRDQLKALCDSAAKYNVLIIVDVLPNHTAFNVDLVSDDMVKAVGGRDKLYHTQGLLPVQDYNDRLQCTLWGSGALPDVNTENPDFQKYYMNYVNDLLGLGVRGFRYDTAKHIGVHSDPVDTQAGVKVNDFWDVALGRKAVKGVKLAVPEDELFIYGEILQDKNVPEAEYADYMGQTASGYGWHLREALEKGSAKGIDMKDWRHEAAPEYLTSWVESHDTYCNAHESAGLSDDQIRMGWVFLTARQNGVPLFFSRPMNSSKANVWGDNIAGARGNDEFFHPEVVAVNKFRQAMKGQKEDIQVSDNGQVLLVNRGKKGAAAVNISTHADRIDLPTALPNGTYRDQVHGKEFKVKNGRLIGILAPLTSYILTK